LRWLFPHIEQTWIDLIHYIVRKGGHLTEYAFLALLLWRAIHFTQVQKLPEQRQNLTEHIYHDCWKWTEAGLTLAIVFLYAAMDEFHQFFVPLRTPMLSDVFIDTCGGAIALIALRAVICIINHE
jgi:VanZ family protein